MGLKNKIHALIDACEDDNKLEEVEALLEQKGDRDWWQDLPEHEKSKTLASLQQAQEGKTISDQQLMEKVWAKFTR